MIQGIRVQYYSNDETAMDWLSEMILICVVEGGYEDPIVPDPSEGYAVAPRMVSTLKKDSAAVIQISREEILP